MINILKCIIILSVSVSLCNAEDSQTLQNESSYYIDDIHKSLSQTVLEWSDTIDTTLCNWLEDKETNTTDLEANITGTEGNTTIAETNLTDVEGNTTIETNTTVVKTNTTIVPRRTRATKINTTIVPNNTPVVETDIPANTLEDRIKSADAFFMNDKYLNETDNNYVRVRVESYFQSKESSDFDLTLRAQIPLSRTKKRFKIFVDDLTLDNANDVLKDTSQTPDIGVHYFASKSKIKSRYSIGLSGIDPFVKARYNMPIRTDKWLIDLVQSFKYSTDDKFEEETNIYFDKEVGKKSLLRLQLHRRTQEEIDGMDYALSAQYYESIKKDTGFGFSQTFFGNTEYQYITQNGVPHPKTKKYAGINDYVTSFSWRENIWRKWFYYEVRPSVSFHKEYDYEPNYRIRFFLDFYFGKYN